MRTRTIGRLGAVAAVALGLLFATAVPASATVHGFDITNSSTVVIGTTNTHIDGGHATTNVCASNSQTDSLVLDLNSTGSGTLSGATAWGDFHAGTSTNFEVRLVITTGTVTITTTTITVNLTVIAEFANCGSTPIVCRTTAVSITSSGANTSGSLHPGASTSTTLNGTSTTVATTIGCNAIVRAAINGFNAVANLSVHITS